MQRHSYCYPTACYYSWCCAHEAGYPDGASAGGAAAPKEVSIRTTAETVSCAPWGGRENEAATPATKQLCFHGRHLRPAFPNRCAALSFLERSASVHANEPTQCAGVHVIALASCGPTHERAARLRRTLRPIMIQLLGSRAQSATCVLRAAQRRGGERSGRGEIAGAVMRRDHVVAHAFVTLLCRAAVSACRRRR